MSFQRKPIIELVNELEANSQSIVRHLESMGLGDDIAGEGLGAAITTERAYQALRDAFGLRHAADEDSAHVTAAKKRPARNSNKSESISNSLIADSLDLIGKRRSLNNAVIKDGYGFLVYGERQFFFHVAHVKNPLRRLLDVRQLQGGVGSISAYLPQPAFEVLETPKGPTAVNVRPHARWERALVYASQVTDPEQMRIAIPGIDGECLLLTDRKSAMEHDGFYIATVWRAIPAFPGTARRDENRHIVQFLEPFSWDCSAIDNYEQVEADTAFTVSLLAPTVEEVVRLLREEPARSETSSLDAVLHSMRRSLRHVDGGQTDLTAALKRRIRDVTDSLERQLSPLTYLRLLSQLDAPDLASHVDQYLAAHVGESVVVRIAAAMQERGEEGYAAAIAEVLQPLREALGNHAGASLEERFAERLLSAVQAVREQLDSATCLALRHRLGAGNLAPDLKTALEAAIDEHLSVRVIDLETDGSRIWELGLGDGKRFVRLTGQPAIEAALARAAGDVTEHLWIGHNLEAWDAPIVARHGLDLSGTTRWDTLRIEALLSPRRPSLALNTSHHADEDAAVAYRLFRSQVIRLLLGDRALTGEHAKTLLQPIRPVIPSVRPLLRLIVADNELLVDLVRLQRAELNQLLVNKTPARLTSALERCLADLPADAGPIHVLYPRMLGTALASLPGARFADEAGSDLGLEVYAGETPDDAFPVMLAYAYAERCRQGGVAPLLAAMPAWARAQLDPHRGRFCRLAASTDETSPATSVWCFPSDYYLRSDAATPAAVVIVEPDLDSTVNTRVLRQFNAPELYAYLDRADMWGRLRAAKPLWQLSDYQAAGLLRDLGYRPQVGSSYWIRRSRADTFDLVEHVYDLNAAVRHHVGAGVPVHSMALDRVDAAALTYVHVEKKGTDQSALHTLRLNPETPYRDRYWAVQSLLLERLADAYTGHPIVLLVSGRDDVADLKGVLHDAGWYVPEGAAHRQLELLRASRHGRRVAVWSAEHLPAILEANVHSGGPLLFVLEALPLQEQYHLGKSAGMLDAPDQHIQGSEEALLHDTTIDETGADEEDGENVEGGEARDAAAVLARFNLHQAFRQIAPRLSLSLGLIRRNHPDHQVVVLDPRLEPVAVPEGFPGLTRFTTEAFTRERFENRLLRVKERIRSVQPSLEASLPDNWQEVLERIFLSGKGGDGAIGSFRDEQRQYLEHIIRRSGDVLVEMPTGGGKSVLFQAPALYHGLLTNRLTFVVTPLKALMADQVDALHKLGFLLEVDFASGDLPRIEIQDIYRRIAGGELVMVYIAPERFRVGSFKEALEHRLASDGDFAYCVFDEAHCVSLWGLDFRPDYLVPVQFVRDKRHEGRHLPCIFLSATVTEQVYRNLSELFE